MSALHILKGTQIFYLVLSFVKFSYWCQATWSFSEQPSYSSRLTLCPALLSFSVGAAPTPGWSIWTHCKGTNQSVALPPTCPTPAPTDRFLHEKRPNGHQTFGAEPRPPAHSSATAHLRWPRPRGEVQVAPVSVWANAAAFNPGSSHLRITWGGFKKDPYPGLIPETLGWHLWHRGLSPGAGWKVPGHSEVQPAWKPAG